jgi:hypothetical protein
MQVTHIYTHPMCRHTQQQPPPCIYYYIHIHAHDDEFEKVPADAAGQRGHVQVEHGVVHEVGGVG